MLSDLHIKNYRGLDDLQLDKLTRLNLIVGKNNVGKTTLLEAVELFTNGCDGDILKKIIKNRGYIISLQGILEFLNTENDVSFKSNEIIFSLGKSERQSLFFELDDVSIRYNELVKKMNSSTNKNKKIDEDERRRKINYDFIEKNKDKILFVPAMKLAENAASLWDKTHYLGNNHLLVPSLQLILPDLENISFVALDESKDRAALIKLKNRKKPIPLNSLGDGVSRLLNIVLALINCEDGYLLVDEIDSGMHYGLLPEMWKLIAKLAEELNIQVFATTHSWDCTQAFLEAFGGNETDENQENIKIQEKKNIAQIIRLSKDDVEMVYPVIFNQSDFKFIARQDIEVR